MRRDAGMILITVLWIIFILSLISFSLAASVRVELSTTQQSFDSERAFYMAKGAAEVVYNAFSKKQEVPDGTPVRRENGEYIFPFDTGEARVHFESNAGFIDINAAADELLGSMFDSLGVSKETKNRLVDSILDWRDADDIPHLYGAEVSDYPENTSDHISRPRNGNFQSADELLLVRNMTPELFYGSFTVDSSSGRYRRVPGVRELITVHSGASKIDVNEAASGVLAAVPSMTGVLAERVAEERVRAKFTSLDDLVNRVPEMFNADALPYLNVSAPAVPAMLVSRATVGSSGVSRTVRLVFKREEKTQILLYTPLLYKKTMETKFDRWRFD